MDAIEKERLEAAHVKLGLISPLLNGTYPDESKAASRRRVSEVPVEMPDGSTVRFKPATLATWEHRYLKHGFGALVNKGRGDCGNSRSIDADMGEEIDASAFNAAALGMVDGVIAAEDTKDAIASAIDMCASKRVAAPTRKHVNFVF